MKLLERKFVNNYVGWSIHSWIYSGRFMTEELCDRYLKPLIGRKLWLQLEY